MAIRCRAARL